MTESSTRTSKNNNNNNNNNKQSNDNNNNNNNNGPIIIHANSKADELTVYQDRAQVRRVAEVSLPAPISSDNTNNNNNNNNNEAEVHILFEMPKYFDRDSVQVRFDEHTAAHVVLRGVLFEEINSNDNNNKDNNKEEDQNENIKEIQKKLREVEKQRARNKLELKSINDEAQLANTLFSRVCGPVTDNISATLDVKFWESQFNEVIERANYTNTTRRDLQRVASELEKEKSLLQAKLYQFTTLPSSPHPRSINNNNNNNKEEEEVNVVTCIVLKVTKAITNAKIFVSYITPGPSWHAEYEVALNTQTENITLSYNAVVYAGAGENFTNIKLSLSSAIPRHGAVAPKLEPWRIEALKQKEEEIYILNSAPAIAESEMNFNSRIKKRKVMKAPAVAVAEIQETSTGVINFNIPGRHSLYVGGTELRVPLKVIELKAEVSYITIPAITESVFTKATCINKSEYLILPGSATVILNGDFVANTQIGRTGPGEKLYLHFGVDSSIEVRRQLLQQYKTTEKASLFNREPKQRILYAYNITLINKRQLKEENVTITMQERIPKSNEQKLVVRLIEPKEFGVDNKELQRKLEVDGIVEMQVNLKPDETVTIPFSFEIEAPIDAEIFGL